MNTETGGRFEILLLEENSLNDWWAMLRPGKRARVGTRIAVLDQDAREPIGRRVQLAVGELAGLPAGAVLLAAGGFMMLLGFLAIRRIVNIEV